MDKASITRETLKHNFLKQIVVRADYRGVDEDEILKALPKIREYLKNNKYVRYRTEIANEVDFHLEDPEEGTLPMPVPDSIRRTTVHVFQHSETGIFVRLSAAFVLISIESARYQNCLVYCNDLYKVLMIVKDNSDFFELMRFGIRKVNQCILLNVEKLNDYFNVNLFKLYNGRLDISRNKTFQSKDCFSVQNKYDVNLICTVVCGEANNGNLAYQIILDSDIYILENHCMELLDDFENKAEAMNDVLFELYKDAITDEFISKLTQPSFDSNNEIIGVEKND